MPTRRPVASPRWLVLPASIGIALLVGTSRAGAQPVDPRVLASLTWRNVGPFRGGRVAAVSGAIGRPGTFYAGLPGGGVWKTTSAGQVWYPVFDAVREVSSVGAVEVAPSNPDVVYVGTGDMITGGTFDRGNGVWKSTDAGLTWTHVGLAGTAHIQTMLVDPGTPDVLLVGALGDATTPGDARGVFRSTDGGRSWARTLALGPEVGVAKLARAFDVPNVVFATTMRHVVPPGYGQERLRSWQLGSAADTGAPTTQVWKSLDGGATWARVPGAGLPRLSGRTSIAVAMRTGAQRLFLVTNEGLWRSDDGGASWRRMAADDDRIRNGQGGYSCGVYVDPQDPDLVYTFNTAAYRSTDGGRTFTGFKGAPGGDDPQQAWIDPTDGSRMLFGYDQGLIVSLDHGRTWSSWYNQSTEQLYHVAADRSVPYWIYATQQDAGAIRTRSRGNLGAVTMFDWNPVNGWEWGTVAPSPTDPTVVFASGNGIVRISYPSEQWINVSPAIDPAAAARVSSSQPLVWAPWDPRELLAGLQFVASTTDQGAHWRRISPDLGIPAGLDSATAATTPGGRGAIESMSASRVAKGLLWVGTTNGLIHVTRDGGRTWRDVSPPARHFATPRRAIVSAIEASPFEAGTAYAAIELMRTGDHRPHLFRTRDYGETWTRIVDGLPTGEPSGSFTRVVRADPVRRGLLFAGTESGVHVSFDDGDHWQSLQGTLPNTPVRDLQVVGTDLVAGTHGRGIWILDGIALLREVTTRTSDAPLALFAADRVLRVRRNVNADTPLPPEVPHARNPLPGLTLDYWLGTDAAGPLTLTVSDDAGRVVRRLSSVPVPPVAEAVRPPHPDFWLAPPLVLPATAGAHRVSWDLRRDAPPALAHTFEINATPHETPASPEGGLVPPGRYRLDLTVGGATVRRTVAVERDPRSPATDADLRAQAAWLTRLEALATTAYDGHAAATALRAALTAAAAGDSSAPLASGLAAATARLDTLLGTVPRAQAPARGRRLSSFRAVHEAAIGLFTAQDNGDAAPTAPMRAAAMAACRDLAALAEAWRGRMASALQMANDALAARGHPRVSAPTALRPPPCVP